MVEKNDAKDILPTGDKNAHLDIRDFNVVGLDELRFEIDGFWTTEDLFNLLKLVTDLHSWYELHRSYEIEKLITGKRPRRRKATPKLEGLFAQDYMTKSLPKIVSIKYASPGLISLKGLGEPLKQIKQFLIYLIDKVVDRKKNLVQIEKDETQIESIRVRNRSELAKARRLEAKALVEELKVLTSMLKNKELAAAMGKVELQKRAKDFVQQRLQIIEEVGTLPYRRKLLSIEYKKANDEERAVRPRETKA